MSDPNPRERQPFRNSTLELLTVLHKLQILILNSPSVNPPPHPFSLLPLES